jgi:hypothetical protein
MLRPRLRIGAAALILALAVSGSAAVLTARTSGGDEGRRAALDALLRAAGEASALCTSAPSNPSSQVNR